MGTPTSETANLDGKLKGWKQYLLDFSLPAWEEIPDIGLYMDQMIGCLEGYFDYLAPDIKGESLVTKAMINNYVRIGVLPRPVGKRYFRVHLAYLIIICLLKHSLTIGQISLGLPIDMPEEQVKGVYSSFAESHNRAARYFCESVSAATTELRGELSSSSEEERILQIRSTEELILSAAIIGGFGTQLAQKLHQELNGLPDVQGAALMEKHAEESAD